jgi:hypothetical protein
MTVPHRNNVAAGAALGPYDDDHSTVEEAGTDPANLAILKPIVGRRYRVAGKHFLGVHREIETPVRNGPVALGGVEGRFHAYLRNYIIDLHQALCSYIIYFGPRTSKISRLFVNPPPFTHNSPATLRGNFGGRGLMSSVRSRRFCVGLMLAAALSVVMLPAASRA